MLGQNLTEAHYVLGWWIGRKLKETFCWQKLKEPVSQSFTKNHENTDNIDQTKREETCKNDTLHGMQIDNSPLDFFLKSDSVKRSSGRYMTEAVDLFLQFTGGHQRVITHEAFKELLKLPMIFINSTAFEEKYVLASTKSEMLQILTHHENHFGNGSLVAIMCV